MKTLFSTILMAAVLSLTGCYSHRHCATYDGASKKKLKSCTSCSSKASRSTRFKNF